MYLSNNNREETTPSKLKDYSPTPDANKVYTSEARDDMIELYSSTCEPIDSDEKMNEVDNRDDKKRTATQGPTIDSSWSSTHESPKSDNVFDVIIKNKKITRSILYLRIIYLLTLVIATSIVASLTHKFMRQSELQGFERHYYDMVNKVEDIVNERLAMKLYAAKALSSVYTSRYGQAKWPNVTMPDFKEHANTDLLISHGTAVSFNPIVTNETRAGWEAYAAQNIHMLDIEEFAARQCNTCRIFLWG